jgi:hypothetical protein
MVSVHSSQAVLHQLHELQAGMQEVKSQCRQVADPLENVTGQGGSP